MNKYYTDNVNQQILLALLKAHGIKRVIASPGGTNPSMVVSFQHDGSFDMYSCVDERSAAYMACGMAEQSQEPVVICCTGATASRNYIPALTEAYYRKLPIVAITCSRPSMNIGHLYPQVTDRSKYPSDILVDGEQLQVVKDESDFHDCEFKVNRGLSELNRRGGGPVHFNVEVTTQSCTTRSLPKVKVIKRITYNSIYPILPSGKIGIFIGSHKLMKKELQSAIDEFCSKHNAVVFHDHTSGYYGDYGVLYSLIGCQENYKFDVCNLDLLIHIGEISGDYYSINNLKGKIVWRVNPDGEIRIRFNHLDSIFEMNEITFFDYYKNKNISDNSFYETCISIYNNIYSLIPQDLPLCHITVAKLLSPLIPSGSIVHPSILNALRSWNFIKMSNEIHMNCNVGGFGIDGCTSSLIGASLTNKDKLFFGITGDLAFFYDLNSIGNRHIDKNVRILLMNDGKGAEFRHWQWEEYDVDMDEFVAGAGHFGNKSSNLVRYYAESLGFKYLSVSTIDELKKKLYDFIKIDSDKPILMEVFSTAQNQSDAWEKISHLVEANFAESFGKDVQKVGNKIKKIISMISK